MDRCDVGFGLGVVSGVVALLESSTFFARNVFSVRMVQYLVAWYVVAAGLSLLVLLAAFMVYKGRKLLGGVVMFAASLAPPVNLILLLIPSPIGSMILRVLYHNPQVAPVWLLFGMMGGILILSIELKQERARAIVFSVLAGVLALYITLNIVTYSGLSTVIEAGTSIFYIILGGIPVVVAVSTFALFILKKGRARMAERIAMSLLAGLLPDYATLGIAYMWSLWVPLRPSINIWVYIIFPLVFLLTFPLVSFLTFILFSLLSREKREIRHLGDEVGPLEISKR